MVIKSCIFGHLMSVGVEFLYHTYINTVNAKVQKGVTGSV